MTLVTMDLYCCWLQKKKVTVFGIHVFKVYKKHSAQYSCHLHLFPVLSLCHVHCRIVFISSGTEIQFFGYSFFFSIERLSHIVKYEYLKLMSYLA